MTRAAVALLPSLVAHLVESTLFLLLMLATVAALRARLTAGSRFSLALLGIVKFAVPSAVIAPLARRLLPEARVAFPYSLQVLGGGLSVARTAAPVSAWPAIALGVWALVAAAMIARITLSRRRLVTLVVRTAAAAEPREVEALRRALQRVGLRRSVDIVRSAAAEAPAVLRIIRPVVVLPHRGCDDLADIELESLLRHEVAHVARHDNLVARVESWICALFWFDPVIWIAQRITVIERERACDEVAAETADERETYLAALTKFCHAAIAPRLPGVSCMATAKLKERIDHVMNYATLKSQAPSASRVTLAAIGALVIFTAGAAIIAPARALASTSGGNNPYAVKLSATRSGDVVQIDAEVMENTTHNVIWSPKITLDNSRYATATSNVGELDFELKTRPGDGDSIAVDIRITKGRDIVESSTVIMTPSIRPADTPKVYRGEPITLLLKDARLRDVFNTFGKLTGLEMHVDDDIDGTVSVDWKNVPWDVALDGLINDNGLKYRVEGHKMFISKR